MHRNRLPDRAIVIAASLGVAMPNFWVGLLLVLGLAIALPLFPATGYVPLTSDPLGWLGHLALPAIGLSLAPAAELTRQVRGSVIGILQRDFVKAATAKGLPRRAVIGKHVLKNTGVTVATVAGIQVSVLLGGSVVMEQVFGLPGLGPLVLDSVTARDLPIVQGIVLVSTALILACNSGGRAFLRLLQPEGARMHPAARPEKRPGILVRRRRCSPPRFASRSPARGSCLTIRMPTTCCIA